MKTKKNRLITYAVITSCILILFSGCSPSEKEEIIEKQIEPSIETLNLSDDEKFYLSSSGADNSFIFDLNNYNFKSVKLWVEYYYKGEKKKDYPIGEIDINDGEKLALSIVEDDNRQLINIYASAKGKNSIKRIGPAVIEYKAPKSYLKEIKVTDGQRNVKDSEEMYIGFICKNKDAISFNEESIKGEQSGESEILRNEYVYMIKVIFYQ